MQKTDTERGGTTGCSTENPSQIAPPQYLDQRAIDIAIRDVLLGEFPKSAPMTAAQRDGWVEVLRLLHPDELRAALAARTDDKSFRPDAYALLEIVQNQRAVKSSETRRQIESRRQAERRAEMSQYRRTDTCAQAADRVFDQFAHIMPSRRNQPTEAPPSDLEPTERNH